MSKVSGSKLETLRADQEFVLLRLMRDDGPVLVLATAEEKPAPETLGRLEHAYSLREVLDPASTVRPLELVHFDGRPALLFEDPGGELLERLLGQPLELPQFLRIAINVSVALGSLHARGIIHRDMKPPNILVDRTTYKAWLCGLQSASRLPRQRQLLSRSRRLLAHWPTWRQNRPVE